jgi:hypothetical protein
MSCIVDNSNVVSHTNQTLTEGTVLDLQDIDIVSVSVTYAPVLTGTATIALYESVDGTNYVAISGLTVNVASPGTTIWHLSPVSRFVKILFTPTSGGVTYSATINARNNSVKSNADVIIPVISTAS